MELHIRPGNREDQVVVVPDGDLDLYASVSFCQTVLGQFDAGKNRVVLDFAGVRYLDSSGVGAVIRLLQKARSIGGELRVANLGGTPRKVLEMSNIISLLKVTDSVDAALGAWK